MITDETLQFVFMIVLRLLRTTLAWTAIFLVTPVFGLATMAVGSFAPNSTLALSVARMWAKIGLSIVGAKVSVEGLENIDLDRLYIIMSNHESSVDIPTLLISLPIELKMSFLAKKSLFSVPFLGGGMKALGFIPVDRKDRSSAKGMFGRTLEGIQQGRSPLVFPEATRTKDGRLLPLQRGGFLLAIKSGLQILPVGLEGPRIMMPDGSIMLTPTDIVVRFGKPIDASEYGVSRRQELTAHFRDELNRLRGSRGHLPDAEE